MPNAHRNASFPQAESNDRTRLEPDAAAWGGVTTGRRVTRSRSANCPQTLSRARLLPSERGLRPRGRQYRRQRMLRVLHGVTCRASFGALSTAPRLSLLTTRATMRNTAPARSRCHVDCRSINYPQMSDLIRALQTVAERFHPSGAPTPEQTARIAEALREITRDVAPDSLYAAAEHFRDRPDIAVTILEDVVRAQPNNSRALVRLANCYWLLGAGPQPVGELASRAIAVGYDTLHGLSQPQGDLIQMAA